MGKVMVSNYRYVEQPEGEDYAVRHVLRPGDDPKDLPKEVRSDLEKRGLIMDERRFDANQNVVLPAEDALRRYEEGEAATDDETEANPSSSDQSSRPSRAAAAQQAAKEQTKSTESKSDDDKK